jgi:large subunit ribosomal protein L25
MKTVSLSGSLRENVGKKDAKKHRREGKVPCVIYGGEKQIHLAIEEKSFKKIIFTPEVYLVNIKVDGKEYLTILQDIQYHPVTDNILHADFLEIISGKPVTIAVPVKIEGVAPGVLQGGRLVKKLRKLKVSGLVESLPEFIMLNIDKLDIGNSIRVKDVVYKNLTFLDTPNAVIVAVKTARGLSEEEIAEEEAAEAAAAEAAAETATAEGGEGGAPKEEAKGGE